ncbi:MAG: 50S ribosomal protein L32 [Candidatus Wallbacteria bacterium]|nr:50S ribosomal protein L32 [Candidatus Wallbacteria bacterium]
MPVPKRKTGRSRRDIRRAQDKLALPAESKCPRCHEVKPPHRVCKSCGYYKDFDVLRLEA